MGTNDRIADIIGMRLGGATWPACAKKWNESHPDDQVTASAIRHRCEKSQKRDCAKTAPNDQNSDQNAISRFLDDFVGKNPLAESFVSKHRKMLTAVLSEYSKRMANYEKCVEVYNTVAKRMDAFSKVADRIFTTAFDRLFG